VNSPERVVVISIDALHPEALTGTAMPNLARQARLGRVTLDGHSTRPPKTLIAHTAMVTGLTPAQSGKTDNAWEDGEPTVAFPTVLDDAKRAGYRTAFFYSKEKLGFLVTRGVDRQALAPDDGVARGLAFLAAPGRAFLFLHLSGLEYAGMESGWLSEPYLAEATEIDRDLAPLFADLERRGSYYLVVTSDHAGHGLDHGTDHPEDGRLPLVVRSDRARLPDVQGRRHEITGLRAILAPVFIGDKR
jgi:predicted AlkP superfamily pyrophosphatase or phosphodiesterase